MAAVMTASRWWASGMRVGKPQSYPGASRRGKRTARQRPGQGGDPTAAPSESSARPNAFQSPRRSAWRMLS